MSPFAPDVRDEIRRKGKWACYSCGKSSFDSEMWLIEAMHNVHKDDEEGGKSGCRICHLLHDLDMGDIRAVNATANRIWNSGLQHYSRYEENPQLMREHRIQLTEMLTALGLNGRIHIKEEVSTVGQLKAYVQREMAKVRKYKK